MIWRAVTGLAAAAALACGAEDPGPLRGERSSSSASPSPWFEEVGRASGVEFRHVRARTVRYWFPEIMGSGLALLDHDGDGDLDLYLVQAGDLGDPPEDRPPNRLYENRGDGTFTDVTDAAGVGDRGYGMGCATGDYDGDGDVDLYVTNVGPNVLYRNDGDGTFTDVTTAAAVGDGSWGTSAAFVDVDADGDLDLFVVNNIAWSPERELDCSSSYGERDYCSPKNYASPAPDVLYRNEGDGTFTDVSREAGLRSAFGNGLGVTLGDFDLDGQVDVYVANDGTPNQLWINQGGGRFEDRATLAGCAVNQQGAAEAGMGVAAADVDEDGDVDLFMTHLREETNTFYLNRGGVFTDRTSQTGLSTPSVQFTGFGMGFADFDSDGILDLYVANGRVGDWRPRFVETDPYAEPDQLFHGLGSARFEEVRPRGGVREPVASNGRGAAFGDLDGDGDVDVVVSDNDGYARILRNVRSPAGHWLLLSVVDARGAPALGAEVRIVVAGTARHRRVQSAYSYCSASDPRVHVGLGDARAADEVRIAWPDGSEELFGPLEADALHELRHGAGHAIER